MQREFIRTRTFDRLWEAIGLGDDELRELEDMLLENPRAGAPHMEGARKVRYSANGKGKSGGVRIVYIDIVVRETIYLLLVYPKNVQDDMNDEQKRVIRKLINALKGA